MNENRWLFRKCSEAEAVESKLVKLEAKHTVILPPTLSVPCCTFQSNAATVNGTF